MLSFTLSLETCRENESNGESSFFRFGRNQGTCLLSPWHVTPFTVTPSLSLDTLSGRKLTAPCYWIILLDSLSFFSQNQSLRFEPIDQTPHSRVLENKLYPSSASEPSRFLDSSHLHEIFHSPRKEVLTSFWVSLRGLHNSFHIVGPQGMFDLTKYDRNWHKFYSEFHWDSTDIVFHSDATLYNVETAVIPSVFWCW